MCITLSLRKLNYSKMKYPHLKFKLQFCILAVLACTSLSIQGIPARDINIKIHLSGVYFSKINLVPLSGAGTLKSIIENQSI